MSKLTKTAIGFFTILLVVSLFAGPTSAIQLAAFSIICTAGVSLVIWIPLSYGVGSLIVSIYESVSKSKKTGGDGPKSSMNNEQKALTGYIHQSRSKGVSDDNIFSLLKNNGWAENAIHEAFGLVATHREN